MPKKSEVDAVVSALVGVNPKLAQQVKQAFVEKKAATPGEKELRALLDKGGVDSSLKNRILTALNSEDADHAERTLEKILKSLGSDPKHKDLAKYLDKVVFNWSSGSGKDRSA